MSKASRLNYLEQLYSGNLEQNAVSILDYIKDNSPINTLELRNQLIYPHQTLTSRLTVLMDFGLIRIVDTHSYEIGGRNRSYSVYEFVYNELEQVTLQDERKTEKAKQWLKGYEKYKDVLKISLIKY
tara:strand:- start:350 stop:730 length:381 start_codon:yes stop_codon:yes gene_type:complete